jgi:hypothetical protein
VVTPLSSPPMMPAMASTLASSAITRLSSARVTVFRSGTAAARQPWPCAR